MHNQRSGLSSTQHADEVGQINPGPGLTSPTDLPYCRPVPRRSLRCQRRLTLRFLKSIIQNLPEVWWRRGSLLPS